MLEIFSIKDIKAGTYNTPFVVAHTIEAIRSFHRAANDDRLNICQFPADFELYKIADFDQENGVVKPMVPTWITNAVNQKEKEKK